MGTDAGIHRDIRVVIDPYLHFWSEKVSRMDARVALDAATRLTQPHQRLGARHPRPP